RSSANWRSALGFPSLSLPPHRSRILSRLVLRSAQKAEALPLLLLLLVLLLLLRLCRRWRAERRRDRARARSWRRRPGGRSGLLRLAVFGRRLAGAGRRLVGYLDPLALGDRHLHITARALGGAVGPAALDGAR